MPNPDDVFISEMEKLGVKFIDVTPKDMPKDKASEADWENRVKHWCDKKHRLVSNCSIPTTELIDLIRQQRKQAAEEAIKAVTPEEAPIQKLHPYESEGPNDGFNNCRAEVIRRGQEHLKTL